MEYLQQICFVCFLMSTSLLRTISGQAPRFTKTPNGPIEVRLGQTAVFDWQFTPQTIQLAYWTKLDKNKQELPIAIMSKTSYFDRPAPVAKNTDYNSRVGALSITAMELRGITIKDDGFYRFHIIFADFQKLSNDVQLIVLETPKIGSGPDRSPGTVQVSEPNPVLLRCGVERGNPKPFTFTWKHNTRIVATSQNNSRYDLYFNVTGREVKGKYECIVTNKAGTDLYDLTLDVLHKPVVISLPETTPVREDGQVTIECLAEGNPNPLTYLWYRDTTLRDRVFPDSNRQIETFRRDGKSWVRIKFLKVPRRLGGAYFCVAQNSEGIGKPKQALLDVMYPPGEIDIPSTGGVVTVTEGQNVTIKCIVDANPKPVYAWLRSGYVVKQNAISGDLNIPFVSPGHAAIYTCQAANRYGQKTKNIRLNVLYGPRRTNLTVQGIAGTYVTIKDRPANLTCVTDSNPTSNFIIQRRGTTQPLGSVKGVYYIPRVTEINEGVYECVASNQIGKVKTTTLALIVAVRPSFINLGANQPETVQELSLLRIECTVKSKPAPVLYWHLDDKNLTNNDTERTITFSHFGMQGLETRMRSVIEIKRVRRTDTGKYKCIAENLAGIAARTFNLNVQYTPYLEEDGYPSNITTFEKRRVHLKCKAKGNPPLSYYKWTLNGRVLINFRGEDLIINEVSRSDAGRYTCNGVNVLGDGEVAVAYVNVLFLPVITVRPQPVTVNLTQNVILICKAIGFPVPKMYWYKDRKLVQRGEILTLNKVTRLEKGRYTCIASNYLGNTTALVTVLVRHPPFIVTNTPSFTKIGTDLGVRATLTCTVDAYPAATLRWKGDLGYINPGTGGYEIEKDGDTTYLRVTMPRDTSGFKKYVCEARSPLGSTSQEYEILPKGPPEPPVEYSLTATDTLRETDPPTSDVRLKWIDGFNGGYSIETFVYHREQGLLSFEVKEPGTLPIPDYTVTGLKTGTTYEFTIRVRNVQGMSKEYKPYLRFTTKTPPPPRATASVAQYGTGGTDVIVKWNLVDATQAQSVIIRYKQVNAVQFQSVVSPVTQSSYIITGLEKGTTYEFHMYIKYKDGTRGWPVGAGKIIPGGGVTSKRTGLSKNEIIAVVVGVGGFLVLLIIGVALFIFRRRNKGFPKRDPRVEFTTAGSVRSGYAGYTTGGSDVVRTTYMEEDAQILEEKQANSEKRNSPPPKYSDVHYYNGSLDSRTSTFQPRNPVGNTPAYSSLSRGSKRRESDRGADIPSKAPSHTSLSSNRAAEIARTQRNPPPPPEMDYGTRRSHGTRENPHYASDGSMDNISRGSRGQRPRPGVENPRYRPDSQNFGMRGHHHGNVPVTNLDFDDQRAQYNANGGRPIRGSSSDDNLSEHDPEGNEQMLAPLLDSTASDEEMPVPPPFLRDAIRTPSDNERVPGSMGAAAADRIGRRKPPQDERMYNDRPYYPERPSYNDGRVSPPQAHSPASSRSGTSSRPYRSDNEYIDDPDDANYVGYLV